MVDVEVLELFRGIREKSFEIELMLGEVKTETNTADEK